MIRAPVIVLDAQAPPRYRSVIATFRPGAPPNKAPSGERTGLGIVSKRIIAAISQNAADPVYYFAGYHDQGEKSECRWTLSRDHARWFDADEAEVEALLLTPDYIDYRLMPEPLTG